jgi:GMP synthase-like glutamine amidotransferase
VRALVVGNAGDADPGLVGERLEHHGFALASVAREEPGQWPSLAGTDLVLLLGSDWSVYGEGVAKQVRAEQELVRESHRRGVPVLGICFGAQIMAAALGGAVARASRAEIGWCDVLAPPAHAVVGGRWMQWHHDAFSVPAGADVLALSDAGPQAMRMHRCLGVQYHPEANEAIVMRWLSGEGAVELATNGVSPVDLMEETRAAMPAATEASRRVVDWFVDDVATGPAAPAPRRNLFTR